MSGSFYGILGAMAFEYLKTKIRDIPDFPTPGIRFKDITPLLEDKRAFRETIDGLTSFFHAKSVDKVVGIDARGFLLASAVAYLLGAGVVIVRKRGKLPWQKIIQEHDLEYGQGALEIHNDSVLRGERVVIIDDVLATGGTAGAAVRLVEALEGTIVGIGFLLEILPLGGREKLKPYPIHSLIQYTKGAK